MLLTHVCVSVYVYVCVCRLGIHEANDGASHSYYSLQPAPGWRVIVLDSYDVSVLGWPQGHPLHEQAVSLLAQNNPNEVCVCVCVCVCVHVDSACGALA